MNRGISITYVLTAVLVVAIAAVIVIPKLKGRVSPVEEVTQKATKVLTGGVGFNFDEDTPGYENLGKLMDGCPFKDCIPSIDNPKFESRDSADEWVNETDVIFILEHKGTIRGYPQRILNWHEIVNDEVEQDAWVITFCPLCGSALAFDRNVNGQVLEFGVSGKLHNNDLVMYDRQTESLWQQITGEAIVGEHFGKRLKQIPLSGMRWSQFRDEFPKAEVLSRDTGFSRNYDQYPYGNYENDPSTLFSVEGGVDTTIHPKAVVYGVEIDRKYKAYPENKLKDGGVIRDTLGGVLIEISYKKGNVSVIRKDNGEEILATRLFWFAWKAFRPESELY